MTVMKSDMDIVPASLRRLIIIGFSLVVHPRTNERKNFYISWTRSSRASLISVCIQVYMTKRWIVDSYSFVEFKDHRAAAMTRRKFKNIVDTNAKDVLDITSMHTTALQNFIREKFSVTSYSNRLRAVNELTFMYKVSVYDHIYLYLFLFPEHIFFIFLFHYLLSVSCIFLDNYC